MCARPLSDSRGHGRATRQVRWATGASDPRETPGVGQEREAQETAGHGPPGHAHRPEQEKRDCLLGSAGLVPGHSCLGTGCRSPHQPVLRQEQVS